MISPRQCQNSTVVKTNSKWRHIPNWRKDCWWNNGDCPQTISNPITGLWLSSRCGRHQIHPTNLVKQTLGSSTWLFGKMTLRTLLLAEAQCKFASKYPLQFLLLTDSQSLLHLQTSTTNKMHRDTVIHGVWWTLDTHVIDMI